VSVRPDRLAAGSQTIPRSPRILVAVSGDEVDEGALRLACRMASRHRVEGKEPGRLYAVHVIEVERSLPLSAPLEDQVQRGEEILDSAETIAGEYAIEVETELVQARDTGPAIVGEANEWKADVIVIGLPYRHRFGEFSLGKTASYVLKNAASRVILMRDRLPEQPK
jgi:nucleotide-binding universal stress UspA family protein